MPKLFWRIFFTLWLSIVGFTSLVAIIGDQVARKSGVEDIAAVLKHRLPPLLQEVKLSLEKEGPLAAREVLLRAPPSLRNLIHITDKTQEEMRGRRPFPRQHRVGPDKRSGRSIEVTDPTGKQWFIKISPLVPPRILLSPGNQGTFARLLLAALLSAIISWILARSLARPLRQLGLTSVALAEGKLQSRVSGKIIDRRDEVGDLARSFNTMATEIETLDKSRQRLLRDVAHELRSPLARMQVAVELARDKSDQTEIDTAENTELNLIAREILRLEKLIAEVLTLLREAGSAQALDKELYSLTELLTGLVARVNYEAEAKGQGTVSLKLEEDIELLINPELIYRAMENLLRNASRYTDASRGVEVTVNSSKAENTFCHICIRDYGPGIPEEFIQHLFEPFSRLSSARERQTGDSGWGLGTAIAAAAIQRHGGSIEASNAVDGGLEISIKLPVTV